MLKKLRSSEYPILDVFLARRSSRALSPEPLTNEELMALFEAARWAQSSYNNQPWRFIYSKNNSNTWKSFLDLLVDANKEWAKNAYALIIVASKNNFDYNNKPSRTHSFDTGAACQNMALEGAQRGIVVHGMEGFDYERARSLAHIPSDYTIEAMFAVGKLADLDELPESLRVREKPSDRKKLDEFVFENQFKN
ncbi:nitroreductase [Candidatus Dependentiae bacterium Noda2021]|nr:nitroreductase [Candidatus Dependentiae bacterium Noda2021]